MPCHAMPCHAMLCYAMPCHAMYIRPMGRFSLVWSGLVGFGWNSSPTDSVTDYQPACCQPAIQTNQSVNQPDKCSSRNTSQHAIPLDTCSRPASRPAGQHSVCPRTKIPTTLHPNRCTVVDIIGQRASTPLPMRGRATAHRFVC